MPKHPTTALHILEECMDRIQIAFPKVGDTLVNSLLVETSQVRRIDRVSAIDTIAVCGPVLFYNPYFIGRYSQQADLIDYALVICGIMARKGYARRRPADPRLGEAWEIAANLAAQDEAAKHGFVPEPTWPHVEPVGLGIRMPEDPTVEELYTILVRDWLPKQAHLDEDDLASIREQILDQIGPDADADALKRYLKPQDVPEITNA